MTREEFPNSGEKRRNQSCMYCGKSVNLERDDAVTESRSAPTSRRTAVQVWHRGCFDDFLEQGEET